MGTRRDEMSRPVPAPADSPVTVREVLSLPVVARGVPEVVAGADHLDRPVRWVHSGEVPYIAEMLNGGELLLMTGIGLGPGSEEGCRLVAELAERGVAAVAIELGSRFKRLPRGLADAAARFELPLVALHREIRFVEVTEAVHREIVGRQLERMRHGDELHRRFTELMLEGAGIPEVLSELAEAIGSPVILEKDGVGVLYHATARRDDARVLAAWDSFTRRLPGAPEAIDQLVPMGGDRRWGRLVALSLHAPLDDRARVGLERAVGLIALALLRERAEEAVITRERGNFLAGLIDGEVDVTEARRRAAAMGFEHRSGLLLPLAVARAPAVMSQRDLGAEDSWMLVWRDLRGQLDGRRIPTIAGARSGLRGVLLLVLAIRNEEARARLADEIAELVADACARNLGRRDAALVCVGPAGRGWSRLGDCLRVTVDALAGAAHSKRRTWHDATRPNIDGLLSSLRDQPEIRRFAETRLTVLLEHDRRRQAKLLPTLAAYCEHGGRKAETARSLHIERQSLYHRLSRIEELLDVDLSDGETMLDLHFALRVHELENRATRPPSVGRRDFLDAGSTHGTAQGRS